MRRVVVTLALLPLLPALASCAGKEAPAATSATSASTPATTAVSSPAAPSSGAPSSSAAPTGSTTSSSAPSAAAPKEYRFSIANGTIDGPGTVTMKPGETILLTISTDRAVTIHAHHFEVEKDLKAGETAHLKLTTTDAGRFDVEDHSTDKLVTSVLVTP